ncbi:thiolase domain-containing protein [bacterium]|nr:thiolase domain-containing protein [bacterium]
MYISGIGRTKFGVLDKTIPELISEALEKVFADSKISPNDIDAIYVANFAAGPFQNQLHAGSLVPSILSKFHIPSIRIESACASGGVALNQAVMSLSKFDNVLVVGFEKMSNIAIKDASKYIATAGDLYLDQKHGLIFPATYALVAQQHMKKYGTTTDDLALVSFKNHSNANLNEYAHFFHKTVSLDDVKNSPVVCSPLRLFDCSPISDGAAAVIISNNKKSNRDVKIKASQISSDSISLSQRNDLTSFSAAEDAAKKAYKESGYSPSDIDIAEVHDCFTIAEIVAMEDLGFSDKGKATELIEKLSSLPNLRE